MQMRHNLIKSLQNKILWKQKKVKLLIQTLLQQSTRERCVSVHTNQGSVGHSCLIHIKVATEAGRASRGNYTHYQRLAAEGAHTRRITIPTYNLQPHQCLRGMFGSGSACLQSGMKRSMMHTSGHLLKQVLHWTHQRP